MGKNKTIVENICEPFCIFYKPGKNEELLCCGAMVYDRLQEAGRKLSRPEQRGEPSQDILERIVRKMCTACDFFEHDCDFMEDRKARPCGGFVVLSLLVASGELDISDLGSPAD
jgi:hypothetical protein